MATHREVECKFDVAADVDLAAAVAGLTDDRHTRGQVRAVSGPVVSDLVATYVDTADLALVRHGATLRRRTGGSDAGWHLKIRTDADERLELRRPLGRSARSVPAVLLDEVRTVVRDRALAPVAVLTTRRVEHRLLDPDGSELAVVADDTVRARRPGTRDDVLEWREVEVELVHGDRDLLTAVGKALRGHGVRPSTSASKLARALGEPAPVPAPDPGSPSGTAGHALHCTLQQLVRALHSQDRAARSTDVDGVHDMRTAVRRLRAALAVHRPLLDGRRTEPLRAELHWLGRQLGELRDVHVEHRRLSAALAELPPRSLPGPVRSRVAREMRHRERVGEATVGDALSSARYFRLLDDLDELLARPPYTRAAHRPAATSLPPLLRRTVRRVRRRRRAVVGDPVTREGSRQLHELRRSVRRARYAAEAMTEVLGKDAARLAGRMHAVQDALGEHQDAATVRTVLRQLAESAGEVGESAFGYGVLWAGEHQSALAALDAYPPLLHRALARKATGWLG